MDFARHLKTLQDRLQVCGLMRAELDGKHQIRPEEQHLIAVHTDLAVWDAAEDRKQRLHRVCRDQQVYGLVLRRSVACHGKPEAVTAGRAEFTIMDGEMHALQLRLCIPALCGREQHLGADLCKAGAVQQMGRRILFRQRVFARIQQGEYKGGFGVAHLDLPVIRCDRSRFICK